MRGGQCISDLHVFLASTPYGEPESNSTETHDVTNGSQSDDSHNGSYVPDSPDGSVFEALKSASNTQDSVVVRSENGPSFLDALGGQVIDPNAGASGLGLQQNSPGPFTGNISDTDLGDTDDDDEAAALQAKIQKM